MSRGEAAFYWRAERRDEGTVEFACSKPVPVCVADIMLRLRQYDSPRRGFLFFPTMYVV